MKGKADRGARSKGGVRACILAALVAARYLALGASVPLGAAAAGGGSLPPYSPPVAHASGGSVLILSSSVNGGSSSAEAQAAQADGLPSSISLPTTTPDTISTSYDATDSASAINLKQGSSTLLGFSYADAPSGSLLSETDTPGSSGTSPTYTYDAQGRITAMQPASGTASTYTQDASGSLTTLPLPAGQGSQPTAAYDQAGEMTSSTLSGSTSYYTYDGDGNRTKAGSTQGGSDIASATWNGAGEATYYKNATATMTSAAYNGDGLRASETASGVTQSFVWNVASGSPLPLTDSNYAFIDRPDGTPVEQVALSGGAISYLMADRLGSIRGIVSASGAIAGSGSAVTSYDAWGRPQAPGGLSGYTPLGYAGGYTDPTGLVYLVNRYYDPSSGQFISPDPMVRLTGQPYSYAANDPPSLVDPSGLLEDIPGEEGNGPVMTGGPDDGGGGESDSAAGDEHAVRDMERRAEKASTNWRSFKQRVLRYFDVGGRMVGRLHGVDGVSTEKWGQIECTPNLEQREQISKIAREGRVEIGGIDEHMNSGPNRERWENLFRKAGIRSLAEFKRLLGTPDRVEIYTRRNEANGMERLTIQFVRGRARLLVNAGGRVFSGLDRK